MVKETKFYDVLGVCILTMPCAHLTIRDTDQEDPRSDPMPTTAR